MDVLASWREHREARLPLRIRDTVAVAVLSRDVIPDFSTELEALLAEIRLASSAVIVVPYKTPPAAGTRPDGGVTSFLCDVETFRAIADRHRGEPTDKLCFRLMYGLLNRTLDLNRIVVRQVPAPARRSASLPSSPLSVAIVSRCEWAWTRKI
jgi:hypothetical protein